MNVLVLNSGSSSLKYRLFRLADECELAAGAVTGIGEQTSDFHHARRGADTSPKDVGAVADHATALGLVLDALDDLPAPDAVGHRVVHGGEDFRQPTLIDATVLGTLRSLGHLAPLHNPANVLGIEMAMRLLPRTPQVAVFDTAFHHTLPAHAYRYGLPEPLYREHGIRRFGFHGTSHAYVCRRAAQHLGRPPASLNLISLHLGNGASAAAVRHGACVDTSMGLTPLEGLLMGTRCGDLDPGVVLRLLEIGYGGEELDRLLNHQSGLAGLCGVNDMRAIRARAEAGDEAAKLARAIFCYRVRKYIGAYFAVLGRVDAVIFTAGIGQHDDGVREQACDGLEGLGIQIDPVRNREPVRDVTPIHANDSTTAVLAIPTNEELEMARQVYALLGAPT
jgi:acetate kinase